MKNKDLFLREIDLLNEFSLKAYNVCNKVISSEISRILKEFARDLSLHFDINVTAKVINKNFTNNLIEVYSDSNNYMYISVIELNKQLKDLVSFIVDSPLINIKSLYSVEKKYKEGMKNIGYYKKLDYFTNNAFDLFIYDMSIEFKLKHSTDKYDFLNDLAYKYKAAVKTNITNLMDNTVDSIYEKFKVLYYDFTKNIVTLNKEIKVKNDRNISDYGYNILQNNAAIVLNESVDTNYKQIYQILFNLNKDILDALKFKENDDREEAFLNLKDYFTSFTNTLYNKMIKIISGMNKIVYYDKETSKREIENYSKNIYKIINMEFNFDKVFVKYKKSMLKGVVFNKDKYNVEMNKIIKVYDNDIADLYKETINTLFNKNLLDISDINYKIISSKYKLSSCLEVVSESVIKAMFDSVKDNK